MALTDRGWLSRWWLDWKLGVRLLRRYPALTVIGGLAFAGAIAMGAIGFEVADELLYKRLPFSDGARIVRLETEDTAASRVESRVLHDFALWRRSLKTVGDLGAARLVQQNLTTNDGRVEPVRVAEITASAFPLTRVAPLLGRALVPADELPGAAPVVVLGHDTWQRFYLGDTSVVGRVVTVGRTRAAVVGVMPPRFGFPVNQQAWVPLAVSDAAPRSGSPVEVFGRLANGASWEQANAELAEYSARLAADEPATHARLRTRVRAFAGRTPGDPIEPQGLAVHAIVLLLLAAVSANVATLVFARAAMRESEIVVRHALGASRSRVVAQIVTETLVLTTGAAIVGLVVAQVAVRYAWIRAEQIMGDALPFWVSLRLEPVTIVYAMLLALAASALVGVVPALKATTASIRGGLQGITGAGGTMAFGGVWSFIVGAQVAATLLFVPAAAGVYLNSINNTARWAEFPRGQYLTFALRMDDDGGVGAAMFDTLAARLREEPGVREIAFSDRPILAQPDWVALEIEQQGAPPLALQGSYEGGFAVSAIGAGFREMFGASVVSGRALTAADTRASNGPVVVNEAFARRLGRNPVGARVRTVQRSGDRQPGPWLEIVGVVTDLWIENAGGDAEGTTAIYRPATVGDAGALRVVVRTDNDAALLAPRMATLAHEADPTFVVREVSTLDAMVHEAQLPQRIGAAIFGGVLLVAVLFSAAGLYALMAVAVSRRTREIGIRTALGATRWQVLSTVFARAARQLGGGIVAGNALILFFAWRADGLTIGLIAASAGTSMVMAIVGVLACAGPARRALRVEPTDALRQM